MVVSASSQDLPRKPLQIQQDDKFFSRLLSKETNYPSFRVYYGVASGSVPFLWESRPGTPKAAAAAAALPPLTPPPSYHSKKQRAAKPSKPSLIAALLPLLAPRRAHPPPSPLSLSSASVSSSSSSSSSPAGLHRRTRSSPRSSFSDSGSDDGLPTSTLCFGARHGCHSVAGVKSALRSIVVGHGTGRGTAA